MNTGFNLFSLSSCKFTKEEKKDIVTLSLMENTAAFKRNRNKQIQLAEEAAEIILRAHERAQKNT